MDLTPRQQAEELFEAMKGFRIKHSFSRKCAKVVCDIMIGEGLELDRAKYWQEVKIELDNVGKQKENGKKRKKAQTSFL